jgi:two-component sensor histidine kinase
MPARQFMNRVPPQRIRTLLVLFALALTLPLLALAYFALNRMAGLEEREIERRALQVAEDLAGDVDRELDRATTTLETLATSAALARGDFAAFHEQAKHALRREQAAILLVDRTNQQLLNTRTQFGAALPQTADPQTAQRVFESKQRQISDLFIGSISHQPVINVEVPVLTADTARYVLIMALDASRFANLLHGQRLEPQWITGITDNKGIILARSERHAEFVGKPLPKDLLDSSRAAKGVFRATSVVGANILRATVRSRIADWLVSATVPVSYVEASRRRGQFFAAVLLGTALALGGALAYLFGRLMARPLEAATLAAAAVGVGKSVEPLSSPLAEANALTAALSAAASELKLRQEHSAFLMRELAHRSKNQLAVVKGMALQTARQSRTVDQFVEQFGRRIQGLAQSQDLMLQQNWQGAWLGDLVRAHLEGFGAGERVKLDGPPLFLSANAVQNIGFALHELATNAYKHGALTSAQGHVMVRWRGPKSDGRLYLEWIERDGPPVQPQEHRGFGSLVITELVAQALQGTAKLDFNPTGIHWRLDIPATFVLTEPTPATAASI